MGLFSESVLVRIALTVVVYAVSCGVVAATTFTVDSTGDGGDSDTADGVCDDGLGNCTLRAAIEQANAVADGMMFSANADILNRHQIAGKRRYFGAQLQVRLVEGRGQRRSHPRILTICRRQGRP